MNKYIFVASVFLTVFAFANARNALRIIDGQDAVADQFPYVVSVQVKTLLVFSHKCGGVIINPGHILTAAQCVYGQTADNVRIKAGTTNRLDKGLTIGAKQIITHPNYSNDGNDSPYDIAILPLKSNLQFSSSIAAIPIASKPIPTSGTGTILGWGSTSSIGLVDSTTLKYASVNLITADTCKNILAKLKPSGTNFNAEANVCTIPIGSGSQSPCNDDAGGPLIVNKQFVATYSWGINCGSNLAPAVYVNMYHFASWINENTK